MHSCNKRHVASAGDFFKRSLGKWLQRNLVSMTGLSIPAFMTQDSIRVGLKCCVCLCVCEIVSPQAEKWTYSHVFGSSARIEVVFFSSSQTNTMSVWDRNDQYLDTNSVWCSNTPYQFSVMQARSRGSGIFSCFESKNLKCYNRELHHAFNPFWSNSGAGTWCLCSSCSWRWLFFIYFPSATGNFFVLPEHRQVL